MNIFVTGGTGFLGRALTHALIEAGNEVTVLSRSPKKAFDTNTHVHWIEGNPAAGGKWQDNLYENQVVINLAGASIFTRWSKGNKHRILTSRISTTQNILQALQGRDHQVNLLLNASAVGYYGFQGAKVMTEASPAGRGFLAEVTQQWEREAGKAAENGIRVLLFRMGIILGRGGGALQQLLPIFRWGAGSLLGKGSQWFSWIHMQDVISSIMYIISRSDLSGAVNGTAPFPVTNAELTKTLRDILHRPALFPAVPAWLLRSALGEFSDILLKGQRVVPKKLVESGYVFKFPTLEQALLELVNKSRDNER